MKFGKYLKQLIERSHYNESQISAKLGLKSRAYLSSVESGREKPPSINRCMEIAEILQLTEKERNELVKLAMLERATDEMRPIIEKNFDSKSTSIPVPKHLTGYDLVPLLGSCPASAKSWRDEETEQIYFFPKNLTKGRKLYLLRIQGDSMNKTGMDNGDLILVDANAEPSNGKIVVARVDDECTVKRFYHSGNQISLIPDSHNPEHQPMIFNASQYDTIFRGVVDSIYMKKVR